MLVLLRTPVTSVARSPKGFSLPDDIRRMPVYRELRVAVEVTTTSNELKLSPYNAAGAPKKCFLPLCWKAFREQILSWDRRPQLLLTRMRRTSSKLDLTRVEEFRPKATAIPIGPKQKLFGR
jgi:hypothetical protein